MTNNQDHPIEVFPAWVCEVVRSGYNNGAKCTPGDRHEGWGCGWRYELSYNVSESSKALLESYGMTVHDKLRGL